MKRRHSEKNLEKKNNVARHVIGEADWMRTRTEMRNNEMNPKCVPEERHTARSKRVPFEIARAIIAANRREIV